MKLSQQSLSTIESAIQKAAGKYVCGCDQTAVTDIHLQPDQTSGQLTIYNDDDEELANVMIEEWATYDGDDFMENVEPSLKSILCRMKEAGDFEKITSREVYISVWEKIAFLIFMLHLYIKVCLFRQTSQLYEDKLTNEA